MGIKHTQEFKDDVVRLVLSGEAAITQIAGDLGIGPCPDPSGLAFSLERRPASVD